jgi:hypothetical protein
MPTATFTFFNSFKEAVAEKKHDFGTDSFVVALTNSAPSSSNTQLSDITEISYTNLSSRALTTSSSSQTSGTYKWIVNDLTLTASGNVATFRYAVIYNDTSTGDLLVGYLDYGSSISMTNTETLLLDFSASNGIFSLV